MTLKFPERKKTGILTSPSIPCAGEALIYNSGWESISSSSRIPGRSLPHHLSGNRAPEEPLYHKCCLQDYKEAPDPRRYLSQTVALPYMGCVHASLAH
ncbi:uncharacterized protein LOC134485262 isoform X2 [Rattus norvegicus]|uniref:uncharacterized protein LOC134485262 isoform X2 n=1 Tax=Rattus norvegicus TaxID=10116 RepID=UPI0001CF3CBD